MQTIFDVFRKVATKEIVVREDGGAVPAGFTAWGTFTLDTDYPDTVYDHIRRLLWAAGETEIAQWSIKRYATAIDVQPSAYTCDLSDGETVQLQVNFTPFDANDEAVTFVSSDPTKATVNATGLVTPVAAGATTITVTNTQSGKTDTVAITVQA